MNNTSELNSDKKLANTSLRPLFPTKYDQAFFVNREKELSIIKTSIKSKLNLLLLGHRGSGKTSLLNHVYYELRQKEEIIPILVNILPKNVSGTDSFLNALIDSCVKEIREHGIHEEIYVKFAGILNPREGLIGFERLMNIIESEKKTPVFLIDGFDHQSELCYDILSSLREILWSIKSPFIFTGDVQQKNVYLKPPVDAFFDKVVEMEDFSSNDIQKLFENRIGIKNIAKNVFSALSEYGGKSITDILLVMRENIENNAMNFDSLLKNYNAFTFAAKPLSPNSIITINQKSSHSNTDLRISPMKREVLKYLRIKGPSSASDKEFQEYTGVSRSRLTQMLLHLTNMGLLTKSKDSQKRRTLFALTTEARNRLTHE